MQRLQAHGIYYLPDTLEEEIESLGERINKFRAGTISAAELKAFRVPMGVYEQRRLGTFMLRNRLPAGGVLPHQMRGLARVAQAYGNGVLHVTTRQDVQIHGVSIEDIYPALKELYEFGLSTKGGGGNSVRNITGCQCGGVCLREIFDVMPHTAALTEFLFADPLSFELPRKFKICFSGCSKDCCGATVNDLGFVARTRGKEQGFSVYVGGGMGAHSRIADLLEDFVPAEEIFFVAEAVKRVFDRHGNRKNKHRARLRFLVEEIGFGAFRKLYDEALAELRDELPTGPSIRPTPCPRPAPPGQHSPSEGFEEWTKRNVMPQRQQDYHVVLLPLFLGDIQADTMLSLADIVEAHGEKMLRTMQSQNAAIWWVHSNELAELHSKLRNIGLAGSPPAVLRNIVACAGASTCKLGICLSRGLAKALWDALVQSGLDLDGLGDLKIHISGCPNACGRHPVGDIGFYGAARRVKGRLVPHYVVQLGGRLGHGSTRLAEGHWTVPARRVPQFLVEFLRAFLTAPEYPDYRLFLETRGRKAAEDIAAAHLSVPNFEEDKNYYFDWGAEELFSLAGRGPGECGAGVFDLIEVDLESARASLKAGKYFSAAALAARALLVTRGEQPASDLEAFKLFKKLFLDEGLVSKDLDPVLTSGIQSASAAEPESIFKADHSTVASLIAAVKELYDNMDQSLRFMKPSTRQPAAAQATAATSRSHDFRGVPCPLNYVKTKIALEEIEAGQTLDILLDEEGGRNVPASAAQDGHEIVSVNQEGNHWRVVIRKRGD